jgi:hypothetical protein
MLQFICMLSLSRSGSFAEEDIGRQGASTAAGNATPGRGLEVAVANLQDYCNGKLIRLYCVFCIFTEEDYCMFNFFFVTFEYDAVELENRLLSRFDAASQRRDLSTMSECAKILSQVNALFCSMPLYNSVGKPVLLSKIRAKAFLTYRVITSWLILHKAVTEGMDV